MDANTMFGALKSGLGGVIIGSASSWVTDQVFTNVMAAMPKGATNNLGMYGKFAATIIVSGGIGAVMLYGGDMIFERVVGDQFLGHILFYQTFIMQSQALQTSASNVRTVLNRVISMSPATPPLGPGPATMPIPPVAVNTRAAQTGAVTAEEGPEDMFNSYQRGGQRKKCFSGCGQNNVR